ncbi:MAG: DUF47 family protein [Chloroflexota bacterium]
MPLSFVPRETKFFDLYEASAANVVKVARLLKEMVDICDGNAVKAEKLTEVEQESGRLTHEIITQLHRTFVTPFDREDMAKLAESLDAVADYIEGAAMRMNLYRAECPVGKAKELADVIVRIAFEVEAAVAMVKYKGGLKRILEKCEAIHRLEYEADCIYRAAVAELFEHTQDLLYVIKWHEIYQFMEDATDRCDDVAEVLEGVVLKYA